MKTFKFTAVEQHIIKLCLGNALINLVKDDKEEIEKLDEFMKGWTDRLVKEDKEKGISEYIEEYDKGVPLIIDLMKKLDTCKEKK